MAYSPPKAFGNTGGRLKAIVPPFIDTYTPAANQLAFGIFFYETQPAITSYVSVAGSMGVLVERRSVVHDIK